VESSSFVEASDIVCNSVTVRNTLYARNMLVVMEVVNQDRIVTGWIKKVIIRGKKVFFLVSSKMCKRSAFRYFQSEEARGILKLISLESLKSYKPLIPRGTGSFFTFFLHGKLLDDFAE
jgi:hypothetical protein